ncbi:kptA, partial [Symbiodinium microadriaticum]
MMIVKIADPVVVMMNQSAPKEDGAGAPTAGKRPARTAQTAAPRNDRPEKIEDGETEACPQPSRGDKNALPMTPTVAQAVPGSMGAMERNLQTVEETSKEATYGASIEGWIAMLFSEEEDDPDMMPKSAPQGERFQEDAPEREDRPEERQGSRGPDPEVEWTEEEEWESTEGEEQEAEAPAPETPADSHLKIEQDDKLDLAALGVYEEGVEAVPQTPPPVQQSLRFTSFHFEYPPRRLGYKYDTKVSKRLSVVLRHDNGEFNLHFYQNATAELDAILDLRIMQEVQARQDTIISCVYYNSKQRFRLLWLHDPERSGPVLVLGAVQGHSKAVDYDEVHERVDPERVPELIHGTHYDFYKKIFKEGLLPGAGNKDYRDQIHLLEVTSVGSRLLPPKCDIILDIGPALAKGCRFYKSANGYYLTGEPIGPQAISAVTIKETRERVEDLGTSGNSPQGIVRERGALLVGARKGRPKLMKNGIMQRDHCRNQLLRSRLRIAPPTQRSCWVPASTRARMDPRKCISNVALRK